MMMLTIWLGVGLGNYANFVLKGRSTLFQRWAPIPQGMRRYRPVRRFLSQAAEGLLEAAFLIVLWPAQLAWWTTTKGHERIVEPAQDWLMGNNRNRNNKEK